jgi:hypothetical protein
MKTLLSIVVVAILMSFSAYAHVWTGNDPLGGHSASQTLTVGVDLVPLVVEVATTGNTISTDAVPGALTAELFVRFNITGAAGHYTSLTWGSAIESTNITFTGTGTSPQTITVPVTITQTSPLLLAGNGTGNVTVTVPAFNMPATVSHGDYSAIVQLTVGYSDG